jgi:hypothetical protein
MQITLDIVQWVAVNVVNDLAGLGVGDLPMLPVLAVGRLRASRPKSLCIEGLPVRLVALDRPRIWRQGHSDFGRGADFVAAPHVFSRRQAINLFRVGVQRIAVSMPHLVVAHAHVSRRNWSVAVQARPANDLPAPSVFSSTVLLNSLVVHQAKAVSSVLPSASFNRASGHVGSLPNYIDVKALGNSWAVPCAAWIGRRIEEVEAMTEGALHVKAVTA